MEVQPITIAAIFELLQKRAAEIRTPLIFEARIAVGPQETRLLDLKPSSALEIIRY